MASFNKAIICGHLGHTPRCGVTESGKAWAELSVATSEKFNGQEKTEWHRVKVWDKAAEFCRDYLSKGALVLVEGRIETRKYTGRDGTEKYVTEIIANRVQGLSKCQERAQGEPAGAVNRGQAPDPADFGPAFPGEASGMDDVPF